MFVWGRLIRLVRVVVGLQRNQWAITRWYMVKNLLEVCTWSQKRTIQTRESDSHLSVDAVGHNRDIVYVDSRTSRGSKNSTTAIREAIRRIKWMSCVTAADGVISHHLPSDGRVSTTQPDWWALSRRLCDRGMFVCNRVKLKEAWKGNEQVFDAQRPLRWRVVPPPRRPRNGWFHYKQLDWCDNETDRCTFKDSHHITAAI